VPVDVKLNSKDKLANHAFLGAGLMGKLLMAGLAVMVIWATFYSNFR
jgi:hypothetical protein